MERKSPRFTLSSIPWEIGLEWNRIAERSFNNPKSLHELFQQHNTIEIPLLNPTEFYHDALAIARQATTKADLDQRFIEKFRSRRQELDAVIRKLSLDLMSGSLSFQSKGSRKNARDITETCSLQAILSFVSGIAYKTDNDISGSDTASSQSDCDDRTENDENTRDPPAQIKPYQWEDFSDDSYDESEQERICECPEKGISEPASADSQELLSVVGSPSATMNSLQATSPRCSNEPRPPSISAAPQRPYQSSQSIDVCARPSSRDISPASDHDSVLEHEEPLKFNDEATTYDLHACPSLSLEQNDATLSPPARRVPDIDTSGPHSMQYESPDRPSKVMGSIGTKVSHFEGTRQINTEEICDESPPIISVSSKKRKFGGHHMSTKSDDIQEPAAKRASSNALMKGR